MTDETITFARLECRHHPKHFPGGPCPSTECEYPKCIAPLTAVAEYAPTASGLAELASRLKGILHDVTTRQGMEQARADRRECVALRVALEAKRKELKADILDRGRLIDGEAGRIRGAIEALETPIDQQIVTFERQKETEREERERVERNRVAEIRGRIDRIVHRPVDAIGLSSTGLTTLIEAMVKAPVDEATFQEFTPEATAAYDNALAKLRDMREKRIAAEAEAAKLAADRAELERQRKAEDERQADARKQEQARAAEQDRIEREASEAAHRDREARAEAARLEREDADRRARQARDAANQEADRVAKEARDKADEEARQARDAEAKLLADQREEQERKAADLARQEAERKAEVERQEMERRDEHARQVGAKLSTLHKDPAMVLFIEAAIEHRAADKDQATERLVALCELYAPALKALYKATKKGRIDGPAPPELVAGETLTIESRIVEAGK